MYIYTSHVPSNSCDPIIMISNKISKEVLLKYTWSHFYLLLSNNQSCFFFIIFFRVQILQRIDVF